MNSSSRTSENQKVALNPAWIRNCSQSPVVNTHSNFVPLPSGLQCWCCLFHCFASKEEILSVCERVCVHWGQFQDPRQWWLKMCNPSVFLCLYNQHTHTFMCPRPCTLLVTLNYYPLCTLNHHHPLPPTPIFCFVFVIWIFYSHQALKMISLSSSMQCNIFCISCYCCWIQSYRDVCGGAGSRQTELGFRHPNAQRNLMTEKIEVWTRSRERSEAKLWLVLPNRVLSPNF